MNIVLSLPVVIVSLSIHYNNTSEINFVLASKNNINKHMIVLLCAEKTIAASQLHRKKTTNNSTGEGLSSSE